MLVQSLGTKPFMEIGHLVGTFGLVASPAVYSVHTVDNQVSQREDIP